MTCGAYIPIAEVSFDGCSVVIVIIICVTPPSPCLYLSLTNYFTHIVWTDTFVMYPHTKFHFLGSIGSLSPQNRKLDTFSRADHVIYMPPQYAHVNTMHHFRTLR